MANIEANRIPRRKFLELTGIGVGALITKKSIEIWHDETRAYNERVEEYESSHPQPYSPEEVKSALPTYNKGISEIRSEDIGKISEVINSSDFKNANMIITADREYKLKEKTEVGYVSDEGLFAYAFGTSIGGALVVLSAGSLVIDRLSWAGKKITEKLQTKRTKHPVDKI